MGMYESQGFSRKN